MEWKLNSEEKAALYGKRNIYKALYAFAIRPYMDFKTGIVGVKRKISYQQLSEEIYEEPHPGEKTNRYGRQQLRRMIKRLEKWGIVKILQEIDRDHLVLLCCLASTDECVQKKADTFCSEKGDTLIFPHFTGHIFFRFYAAHSTATGVL